MSLRMSVLIAAYAADLAAVNIADRLITKYSFTETGETSAGKPIYRKDELLLAYLEIDDIFADNIDHRFHVDKVVFASRHRSESGEPTLTTHVSGNLTSEARFGGRPNRLALADPCMVKAALQRLRRAKDELGLEQYRVSVEATHHGPTELQIPSVFVEIGSSEKQWQDTLAAEAVADAIHACAKASVSGELSVGFGGGHYSMKHTEVNMGGEFAVGHILPKYFFDTFDPSMVRLAFERTVGRCTTAVIDWKGVRGPVRKELVDFLESQGKRVVRV